MSDTPTVSVTPTTSPGPGGRIQRTAGHVGASSIFLKLWFSFGWLGADHWDSDQTLAVSGAVIFGVAAGHNLVNWWSTRAQPKPAPTAVEVTAIAAPSDKPPPPPPSTQPSGRAPRTRRRD